jgi:hypothetical protein
MAEGGETWDLSDNDLAALRAVLSRFDEMAEGRPVCRLHRIPKRAHYFCNECRKLGENVVVAMRGSSEPGTR